MRSKAEAKTEADPYGMTTKEQATARATAKGDGNSNRRSLRDDNKRTGNDKGND